MVTFGRRGISSGSGSLGVPPGLGRRPLQEPSLSIDQGSYQALAEVFFLHSFVENKLPSVCAFRTEKL